MSVTLASWTTAPAASVTVPEISPFTTVCAAAGSVNRLITSMAAVTSSIVKIGKRSKRITASLKFSLFMIRIRALGWFPGEQSRDPIDCNLQRCECGTQKIPTAAPALSAAGSTSLSQKINQLRHNRTYYPMQLTIQNIFNNKQFVFSALVLICPVAILKLVFYDSLKYGTWKMVAT